MHDNWYFLHPDGENWYILHPDDDNWYILHPNLIYINVLPLPAIRSSTTANLSFSAKAMESRTWLFFLAPCRGCTTLLKENMRESLETRLCASLLRPAKEKDVQIKILMPDKLY